MINKFIEIIREKHKETRYEEHLHIAIFHIIHKECLLSNADITEEPDILNKDSLILVI